VIQRDWPERVALDFFVERAASSGHGPAHSRRFLRWLDVAHTASAAVDGAKDKEMEDNSAHHVSVERFFDDADALLASATKGLKTASSIVKRCVTASAQGDLKILMKAVLDLNSASTLIGKPIADICGLSPTGVDAALSGGSYLRELSESLERAGVDGARLTDNALLSYPFRVTSHENLTVSFGKKSSSRIRPSVVAEYLKGARRSTVSSPGQPFLEALEIAYYSQTSGSDGEAVRISKLYESMVLAPQARKLYSESDFVADLNALDRAHLHITRNNRRLSFPKSTGTYSDRAYQFVNPDGEAIVYSSVRFDPVTG